MWIDFIKEIPGIYEFNNSVSLEEIIDVEQELNVKFTEDLRTLLLETNGFKDEFGCDLIWRLERIREDNLYFRGSEDYKELYKPFDSLLFISDAGNGDQFAYSVSNGTIQTQDIFAWSHEDDRRFWVASSLVDFIKGWLSGSIGV